MNTYLTSNEIEAWGKKHRKFLDSINIGFMLFDPDYTCHDVNDAFLQMVGAKRSEYLRVNMSTLFSSEEFQELYNLIEPLEVKLKKNKSIDEKKYYMFEWFWYHHQTREKIPMLCTGAVNLDENGIHKTTYITCTDLRVHKQMQKELIQEKNKLEAILFGIGDSVTIFDLKGKVLFGNPQGKRIREKHAEPLIKLKSGKNTNIERSFKIGKRKYKGKMKTLHDNEGEIFGYAEILKDVTDQLKLEQQGTELSLMKREMRKVELQSKIIGVSHSMRNIFELIIKCAKVQATVLVMGDTGTGKEMVARAIHNQSNRKEKPFIAVNCGALPEALLESELFGHVKGAFTGAISEHKGLFKEADGGTLFLDEIGDLTPTLQVKLLRVLQDTRIRPVGSNKSMSVDVRVIAATHRDLKHMINQKKYRGDLYYRLAVIPITIPTLTKRKEDILPLAEHFIKKYRRKKNRPTKTLDHPAQTALLNYHWPGNVRELENCIEHALAMTKTNIIDTKDLPVHVAQPAEEAVSHVDPRAYYGNPHQKSFYSEGYNAPDQAIQQRSLKPWEVEEKHRIEQGLIKNSGNRTRTAKYLEISRGTLWRKISLYQIEL